MAFINNKKMTEIRIAAQNGNEKAQMILQAMRKMSPQSDVDNLVSDYYSVPVTPQPEELNNESNALKTPQEEAIQAEANVDEPAQEAQQTPIDISADLDKDMDGLLDDNDIDDMPFKSYLDDKVKNGLRAKKNAEYFKMYDVNGRQSYMNDKIGKHRDKFGVLLKDIDKRHNDTNKAIDIYSNGVNNMLDDEIELDPNKVDEAYSKFIGSNDLMHSFGRHWDDDDNKAILEGLHILMEHYGKKNVLAALNTLRSDNDNYRDFMNNKVDTEIGRYSKSIENLLK